MTKPMMRRMRKGMMGALMKTQRRRRAKRKTWVSGARSTPASSRAERREMEAPAKARRTREKMAKAERERRYQARVALVLAQPDQVLTLLPRGWDWRGAVPVKSQRGAVMVMLAMQPAMVSERQ